jgi:hypothetical protein
MTTERAATQLQGCIATVPTSGVGVDMSAARGGEAVMSAQKARLARASAVASRSAVVPPGTGIRRAPI